MINSKITKKPVFQNSLEYGLFSMLYLCVISQDGSRYVHESGQDFLKSLASRMPT